MKHVRANRCRNTFRRYAGWCGLLLYVMALSPVGMAATAVLGAMDSDHQAIFQSNTEGVRLVLRHFGSCAAHRHHAVAQVLTWFASPINPANPDHVLQFSSAFSLAGERQSALVPPNPTNLFTDTFPAPCSVVTVGLLQLILQFHPPPDNVVQRCCPRSAVLLI